MNVKLISFLFILFFKSIKLEPIVINTWTFTEATKAAWNSLMSKQDSLEALVAGCSRCEELQCDHTVGFGGSPDENGETTLEALIFDGLTMNMGAVASLRRIKNAIGVAKHVLKHTKHSILAGDQATQFAIEMGFKEEILSTDYSKQQCLSWKENKCQPNFWENVSPDSRKSCGPYKPLPKKSYFSLHSSSSAFNSKNHDTVGMIVINNKNHIVSGTSTNGANHKIPGVGDSPIPGAGAYADNTVGAACATGDGDVMMRFLPSFLAVDEMRRGNTPSKAARTAIERISEFYPNFFGAVIAVDKEGKYGAACNGMDAFHFSIVKENQTEVKIEEVRCKRNSKSKFNEEEN